MPSIDPPSSPDPQPRLRSFCVLAFDEDNCMAVRAPAGAETPLVPAIEGAVGEGDVVEARAAEAVRVGLGGGVDVRVARVGEIDPMPGGGDACTVFFHLHEGTRPARPDLTWASVLRVEGSLKGRDDLASARTRAVLAMARSGLIRVPYLNFSDNEYVFRFRTEEQRNRDIYHLDERARRLYQSALCEAIKAVKRRRERSADTPALLDFGAIRYLLPSHFGFCLGVQNAIERAYETIAENAGRRVFMISELIHNPFVNEDLRERGLTYLQSDRGRPNLNPETGRPWWDELREGDIVLTPAFGATDEDKVRLIERGIAVNRYDATCMLVEKVWKAARRFSSAGYTVIIHGKSEHEETKATFSNCAKYGPALVVRGCEEARLLAGIILEPDRSEKERRFAAFAGRHTPDFDVVRDLDRLAVVNQTTLLRNETLAIIDLLESVMIERYGREAADRHLHPKSRGDTLCYATQVNQDALGQALDAGADYAIVVGGRNSSNTYQLFRMCEARFGEQAYYIQSERSILSCAEIEHYEFPHQPISLGAGACRIRPFLDRDRLAGRPPTILITGGASCPDGLIQQVIARINSCIPDEGMRSIESVLESVIAAE